MTQPNAEDYIRQVSTEAKIAMLSVRVFLEFGIHDDTASLMLESYMVEHNLRTVYSIPENCNYLHTGYPSEPVVAESAARMMSKISQRMADNSDATFWAGFLATQMDNFKCISPSSPAQAGMVAMRLLLTCGHDSGVLKMAATPLPGRQYMHYGFNPGAWWDEPVYLVAFIQALLGSSNATLIKNSKPSNDPTGDNFSQQFEGAIVRFTHFVPVYDTSMLTDDAMWAALAPGAAWQLPSSNNADEITGGIDIVIPVLLKNTKLSRFNVTALLIQVHNTKTQRMETQRPRIDLSKTRFFSDDHPDSTVESKRRPYIFMTANLGIDSCEPSKTKPAEIPQSLTSKPSDSDRTSNDSSAPFHPQFAFRVNGCCIPVYDVIEPGKNDPYHQYRLGDWSITHWKRLLRTSNDIRAEPPRQSVTTDTLHLHPAHDKGMEADDSDERDELGVGVFCRSERPGIG